MVKINTNSPVDTGLIGESCCARRSFYNNCISAPYNGGNDHYIQGEFGGYADANSYRIGESGNYTRENAYAAGVFAEMDVATWKPEDGKDVSFSLAGNYGACQFPGVSKIGQNFGGEANLRAKQAFCGKGVRTFGFEFDLDAAYQNYRSDFTKQAEKELSVTQGTLGMGLTYDDLGNRLRADVIGTVGYNRKHFRENDISILNQDLTAGAKVRVDWQIPAGQGAIKIGAYGKFNVPFGNLDNGIKNINFGESFNIQNADWETGLRISGEF